MLTQDKLIKKYPRMFIVILKILLTAFIILLPIALWRRDWLYVFLCVAEIVVCWINLRDVKRRLKQK